MKKFFILFALTYGVPSFADDLVTKINSFTYTGSRTWTAELCGNVTGEDSKNALVTVTVDEKSKKPAKYTTIADENGEFCLVVASYRGTASALARAQK